MVLTSDTSLLRNEWLIGDDLPHDRCQGGVQFIRLLPTEKLCEITLGVCVNQKNFFTLPRKTNGQTCCRGGFPDTALLIGQCDCVHDGTSVSFTGQSPKRGGCHYSFVGK